MFSSTYSQSYNGQVETDYNGNVLYTTTAFNYNSAPRISFGAADVPGADRLRQALDPSGNVLYYNHDELNNLGLQNASFLTESFILSISGGTYVNSEQPCYLTNPAYSFACDNPWFVCQDYNQGFFTISSTRNITMARSDYSCEPVTLQPVPNCLYDPTAWTQ